jgi:hypothetical protein
MKFEIDIADQTAEILQFIREQTELDLDENQLAELFSRHIWLVSDIADLGWHDTEVCSRITNLVAERFLGCGWPTCGEQVDLRAFIDRLKMAALSQGFRILAVSDVSADGDKHPSSVTSHLLEANAEAKAPSISLKAILEQQLSLGSPPPSFVVFVTHPGGREALLRADWLPSRTANKEGSI